MRASLLTCYTSVNQVPPRRWYRPGAWHSEGELRMLVQSSLPFPAPEEWRPIAGLEGRYEVSDLGRVRSLWFRNGNTNRPRPTPLIVAPAATQSGHLRVDIGGRNRFVHRLVLEAFGAPCPAGMQCAHLNGRATDNRRENLAWVTPTENQAHRIAHGTSNHGDRNPSRRHPDRLARGERHGWQTHPESRLRGERNGNARLTREQVRAIRVARAAGETFRGIAARYGVGTGTIVRIVQGATWRND
jgi:hypothetical protein